MSYPLFPYGVVPLPIQHYTYEGSEDSAVFAASIIAKTAKVVPGMTFYISNIEALFELGEEGKGFLAYKGETPVAFYPKACVELCDLVPYDQIWFVDKRGCRVLLNLGWKSKEMVVPIEDYNDGENLDDSWFDVREP
jgi:hypothetical protein